MTTTVDKSSDYAGEFSSIAIDASGKAHISYRDGDNGVLRYATNASGAWVTTTVDSSEDVGAYASIAIGTSGSAHISYYNATNGDIKYATNASGAWTTTIVDDGVGSL